MATSPRFDAITRRARALPELEGSPSDLNTDEFAEARTEPVPSKKKVSMTPGPNAKTAPRNPPKFPNTKIDGSLRGEY